VQRASVPKQIKPKNASTFRPNVPWSVFYGVNQHMKCGESIVLFISSYHFFSLNMGVGIGSNLRDELLDLWALPRFARDRGAR
jgi:hypothetical protein